jgi:hypothetical protein
VAEVLARRHSTKREYRVCAEVTLECRGDPRGHVPIVAGERILIVVLELGRLRASRRFAFGADDTLEAADDSLADAHVIRPQIRQQDGPVGNDVALGTRRNAANGQDGEIAGLRFSRNDRLEPNHHL